MEPTRPKSRDSVRIAIICALTIEAGMVEAFLDPIWRPGLKKAEGDSNSYTTGVLSGHNVVIAYLAGAGSDNAAAVAANLRLSYKKIEIALVVGVCGVVPVHPKTGKEIVLGDVVISSALIKNDFGRKFDGGFQRKTSDDDVLGRAPPEVRSFTTKLQTEENQEWISSQLRANLQNLQLKRTLAKYPSEKQDHLYKSDYAHGHASEKASCVECLPDLKTCLKSCKMLGCKDEYLVSRERLKLKANTPPVPNIHFGRMGSANYVLRSGRDRDEFARKDEIVAFEMEGAGTWDTVRTIVIKSACDYADAHKNKDFHPYAAATAAAALKAIIVLWDGTDEPEVLPEGSTQRPKSSPDQDEPDDGKARWNFGGSTTVYGKQYHIKAIHGGAQFN